MVYYDIHTHCPASNREDIAVISIDMRNTQVFREDLPQDEGRYYSVGIHPWHIDDNDMTKVRNYATLSSVVAIGETGLDKMTAVTADDFILQQELFVSHIHLSEEVRKPLIIHCVKAWDELLHIRKAIKPSTPWVIHGFRGNKMLANQLLNAGLYLSFGNLHNIEALNTAWEKRQLLAETDDHNTNIRDVYKLLTKELSISENELSTGIGAFFDANIIKTRKRTNITI